MTPSEVLNNVTLLRFAIPAALCWDCLMAALNRHFREGDIAMA